MRRSEFVALFEARAREVLAHQERLDETASGVDFIGGAAIGLSIAALVGFVPRLEAPEPEIPAPALGAWFRESSRLFTSVREDRLFISNLTDAMSVNEGVAEQLDRSLRRVLQDIDDHAHIDGSPFEPEDRAEEEPAPETEQESEVPESDPDLSLEEESPEGDLLQELDGDQSLLEHQARSSHPRPAPENLSSCE